MINIQDSSWLTHSYKTMSEERKKITPVEACLEPFAELYLIKHDNKPAGWNFYSLEEIERYDLPYKKDIDGIYFVGKTDKDLQRLIDAVASGDHSAIGEALGYPKEYIDQFCATFNG